TIPRRKTPGGLPPGEPESAVRQPGWRRSPVASVAGRGFRGGPVGSVAGRGPRGRAGGFGGGPGGSRAGPGARGAGARAGGRAGGSGGGGLAGWWVAAIPPCRVLPVAGVRRRGGAPAGGGPARPLGCTSGR